MPSSTTKTEGSVSKTFVLPIRIFKRYVARSSLHLPVYPTRRAMPQTSPGRFNGDTEIFPNICLVVMRLMGGVGTNTVCVTGRSLICPSCELKERNQKRMYQEKS